MSAYEELVDRCLDIGTPETTWEEDVTAILAEVLRTLKTVTPEMSDRGLTELNDWDRSCGMSGGQDEIYLAMLHASPLEPPK